MARNFVRASSHYLSQAGIPVTGPPYTFVAWAKSNNGSNYQCAFQLSGGGAAGSALFFAGAVGGTPIQYFCGAATATTSTGYSTGTWHHIAATKASATSHSVYIDGGSKGTSGTSATIALTSLQVGRRGDSAHYFDGDIAECAIWDIVLTDAEIALLAKKVSPLMVHPESLRFYAPLMGRHSTEIDIIEGRGLTVNSAAYADHPRMFLPPTGLWTPKGAAGGGPPPTNTRRYSLSLTGVG